MTRPRFANILILTLIVIAQTFFPTSAQAAGTPVVRAIMFWMDGCPHCEDVIQNVLPPLYEKHGAHFELFMIEVVDTQDVETLYSVAASYNIPKEQTGVPFLIIGEQVLVGSDQVRSQLPVLIDDYLAQGGVDWTSNPTLTDLLPTSSPASIPTSDLPAVKENVPPVDNVSERNNGFTLAIFIMVGMILVSLYSVVAFVSGKSLPLPNWTDWLIPVLLIIGFGVAGYLSYVETESVEAICGPVGDCNTVQQSRYATLFGILPIGILGLLGYLGMLAAWLTRKYFPKFAKPADIAFFSMAFFAVIFSLYLTYLEPFVIRSVCIWCLTSAVIVTLLLLLSVPAMLRQFASSESG